MSTLGAFHGSALGSFIASPLGARGAAGCSLALPSSLTLTLSGITIPAVGTCCKPGFPAGTELLSVPSLVGSYSVTFQTEVETPSYEECQFGATNLASYDVKLVSPNCGGSSGVDETNNIDATVVVRRDKTSGLYRITFNIGGDSAFGNANMVAAGHQTAFDTLVNLNDTSYPVSPTTCSGAVYNVMSAITFKASW